MLKELTIPKLFGPLKYGDLSQENKLLVLRDLTVRVVTLLLLPYLISFLASFALGIGFGVLLNEVIIWKFASQEAHKSFRHASVVISGAFVFGSSVFFSVFYGVFPFYKLIFSFLGLTHH